MATSHGWVKRGSAHRAGARCVAHMKCENLLRIRRVGRRDVNCLSNCEYCVFYVCVCVYCVYVVCVCVYIFFVFVCFSFGQFSHAATKFDWALDCDLWQTRRGPKRGVGHVETAQRDEYENWGKQNVSQFQNFWCLYLYKCWFMRFPFMLRIYLCLCLCRCHRFQPNYELETS